MSPLFLIYLHLKTMLASLSISNLIGSSSSVNLPILPNSSCVYDICSALPKSILRVKGCAQVEKEEGFIYFERTPDGAVSIRPFNGVPITGSKLLTIGPGSDPELLDKVIEKNIK